MDQIVQDVLGFIRANREWAGPIAFAVAFVESLAFISLAMPSTLLFVGLGALAAGGHIDIWACGFGAAFGAIAGDAISYWIGLAFKEKVAKVWPFSRQPHLLAQGRAFFLKHGGKSVFIGRFLGPLRATVPIVAGMMNMPQWRFQFANVASAFPWVAVWIAPGAFLGYALSEYMTWALGGVFVFGLAAGWLVFEWLRRKAKADGRPPPG